MTDRFESERQAFIQSCKKAGLKIRNNPNKQVAKKLVIRDDKGFKYTVDSNLELKPILPCFETSELIRLTSRMERRRAVRVHIAEKGKRRKKIKNRAIQKTKGLEGIRFKI